MIEWSPSQELWPKWGNHSYNRLDSQNWWHWERLLPAIQWNSVLLLNIKKSNLKRILITVRKQGEMYFHDRTQYLAGRWPIIDSMSAQNLSDPIFSIIKVISVIKIFTWIDGDYHKSMWRPSLQTSPNRAKRFRRSRYRTNTLWNRPPFD